MIQKVKPRRTLGDDNTLPCPMCGMEHMFHDWLLDGWKGGEHVCENCEKPFEVTVEYCINLSAKEML